MKKAILAVIAGMMVWVVWVLIGGNVVTQSTAPLPPQESVPQVTLDVVVPPADPKIVRIPKIGVDTEVEAVGQAEDGRMGVPGSAYTTGWWKLGAKPGSKGNAVLAGHLDTPQGGEGIFYRLGELDTGDEIKIEDQNGTVYVYEVVRQMMYADITFPLDEVFGETTEENLNLITCSGIFDKTSQNYDKRLVVYSRLKR